MIPISSGVRVWISSGHCDMRKGMQCLALLVRQVDDIVVFAVDIILTATLFRFIEEAINMLFAARRKTMKPCKRQLLLKSDDVLRKRFLLRLQRGDFGSVCCQLRHQIGNGGTASSYHSR